MKQTGVALIILGIVLTFCSAFTFFTNQKVCDIGPMQITKSHPDYRRLWPLLGIVIMGAGGVVLWQSFKGQYPTH